MSHTSTPVSATSIIVASALLSACSTFDDGKVDMSAKHHDSVVQAVAMFSETCPSADGKLAPLAAGLLTGLLPGLIDKGVSFAATAIKEAGADKTETVEASASANIYRVAKGGKEINLDEDVGCLTVYYRKIGENKNHDPIVQFEGRIEPSPDKSAFRISPVSLQYNRNLVESWTGTKRDLIFTFTFSTPSTEATGSVLGLASIPFMNIQPIAHLDSSNLVAFSSTYIPLPAVSDVMKTRAEKQKGYTKLELQEQQTSLRDLRDDAKDRIKANQKDGKETAALSKQIEILDAKILALVALEKKPASTIPESDLRFGAVNVKVHIAETRHGSKYLVALGEALEGAKPTIKTSVENALIPRDEQAELDSAKTTILGLRVATDSAKAAYEDALAQPGTTNAALTSLMGNYQKAVLAENVACRAAGFPIRYPDPI